METRSVPINGGLLAVKDNVMPSLIDSLVARRQLIVGVIYVLTSICALGAIGACGCGSSNRPTLVPVTGKALMQGQPLTAGAIIFHPDAGNGFQEDKPSSLLQMDGSFTIKTFPFGDGVPPGKYVVTLAPELASRIKRPELSDPKKSPWKIDVPDEGVRDKVFEVP